MEVMYLTALQQWQEQVAAMRRERKEPQDQLWQRLAAWHNNWVRHNDYVELVFPRLRDRVDSESRVLEIGPGSGGFTLPLARAVKELVAVEPASNMRDLLAENLVQAGLQNVRVVPRHVEDGLEELPGPFDLAVASHSLYNVLPIDAVVRELVRMARHVVILMGTGEQREWYQSLYRRFKGRAPVSPPHVGHFYPVLLEMGIFADVEILWTSYNYVFESEDTLVTHWARQFHLDEGRRSDLEAALLPMAERRGQQIGLYDDRRAALITIDRARNLFFDRV